MATRVLAHAAYYVVAYLNVYDFVVVDQETGAINFTSNPHEATLWTNRQEADSVADSIKTMFSGTLINVVSCAQRDLRVIVETNADVRSIWR